jgi:hypothetical protein
MSFEKLTPDTLQAIDLALEDFFPQSVFAGREMASVELKTSQIRGLENLVASTRRFSEIVNYIKNQTGKERGNTLRWRTVSETLLNQLRDLETAAENIAGDDGGLRLAVKLRLARGWCRQVVAHYLYENREGGAG